MNAFQRKVGSIALFATLGWGADVVLADPSDGDAGAAEARVEALLKAMTLDEKIGQMTQVDLAALKDRADIRKYALGSVLSGGNSDPPDNSPASWAKAHDECQAEALKTRLKIPIIYGIDAVHGHNTARP